MESQRSPSPLVGFGIPRHAAVTLKALKAGRSHGPSGITVEQRQAVFIPTLPLLAEGHPGAEPPESRTETRGRGDVDFSNQNGNLLIFIVLTQAQSMSQF